jgi:hypothetical protein
LSRISSTPQAQRLRASDLRFHRRDDSVLVQDIGDRCLAS